MLFVDLTLVDSVTIVSQISGYCEAANGSAEPGAAGGQLGDAGANDDSNDDDGGSVENPVANNSPADEVTSLPYKWDDILRIIKRLYSGEISDVRDDQDDSDHKKMNWFFRDAVPIVASEWMPKKNCWDKPYIKHVTTSDEVMALWLLKHYPDRRKTRAEMKLDIGPKSKRMSYKT